MEKCPPLACRTDSGMDSLIRNTLYKGLSVPTMSDQWLFEDSDAFISVSLYKNVLIEIIKPETPYRVMEDGSLRPQITHTEPN